MQLTVLPKYYITYFTAISAVQNFWYTLKYMHTQLNVKTS